MPEPVPDPDAGFTGMTEEGWTSILVELYLVQLRTNKCPIYNRHAREGGHPGFSSGFPPKARGNDVSE